MALSDSTIIIADDLTGANDTALQFFKQGCKTRVVIDCTFDFASYKRTLPDCANSCNIWAMSTESRNIDKKEAVNRVAKVCAKLQNALEIQNFYKKIDSTLRGNTGLEIIALLEAANKDVAVVVPAYIEEGRTTIGAYQLLNGVPIERTQCALDPLSPIYDSYIPNIIKKDLNPELFELIDTIGFDIVTKGAGPITLKINELAQAGKKIIVVDAMSTVDLEQIALAIDKSSFEILPCASAGLAQAINKITRPDNNNEALEKNFKNIPRLIISGSATQLTKKQIEKLKEEKEIFSYDLTIDDVLKEIDISKLQDIVQKLNEGHDIIIHASNINDKIDDEELTNKLIDASIAKDELSATITDFLAELTRRINAMCDDFILITLGGETSFKCAFAIQSIFLEILDAILPAVPLCKDKNGRYMVTKSGNFGSIDTLVNIINYFK